MLFKNIFYLQAEQERTLSTEEMVSHRTSPDWPSGWEGSVSEGKCSHQQTLTPDFIPWLLKKCSSMTQDTIRLFFWYALNKINKIWLHENVRVCAKLLKFNKKWNWCPRVTQSQLVTDDLNASASCFAAHVEHDTPRRKVNVKSWMPALFWTCLLSDSCVRTGPYICSYLIENKTCPKMYVKLKVFTIDDQKAFRSIAVQDTNVYVCVYETDWWR